MRGRTHGKLAPCPAMPSDKRAKLKSLARHLRPHAVALAPPRRPFADGKAQ